jgi:hypothetical protein
MTVRFDGAWSSARRLAEEAATRSYDLTLIRDLVGRISLIIDDRVRSLPSDELQRFERQLAEVAGSFASPTPALLASDMFDPDSILADPALIVAELPGAAEGRLRIADRGAVGADWSTVSDVPEHRVTLYGFKGGIGRSTATFMLAQHLAEMGRAVLVVDLDLESPGIGSLLQAEAQLPDYGLVDHLVEAAVGNEAGLDLVVRSQVVDPSGNGEVWLAPAGGRPRAGYDYISKLNRVYADLPAGDLTGSGLRFGDRIQLAVEACEAEVARLSRSPEVVLIDSRAGVHDLAAVAITQLSGLSLLFAVNNPQTWAGYGALFRQWGRIPHLARVMRERIRMVATFVPESAEEVHLARFRDYAQACLAETLYDDAASDDPDAYNPGLADNAAPHTPLPILYTSQLVGLDHTVERGWYSSTLVGAAYQRFVQGAAEIILGGES